MTGDWRTDFVSTHLQDSPNVSQFQISRKSFGTREAGHIQSGESNYSN